MEERVHPIPFRTRQLSSPSSMILRTLTWESRTTPRLYFQKPFRFAREGFCFAQRQPGGKPFLKKGLSPGPPLPKTSPLIESLPQHAPLRKETARRRTFLVIPPHLSAGAERCLSLVSETPFHRLLCSLFACAPCPEKRACAPMRCRRHPPNRSFMSKIPQN